MEIRVLFFQVSDIDFSKSSVPLYAINSLSNPVTNDHGTFGAPAMTLQRPFTGAPIFALDPANDSGLFRQ
jgi:hypothetical protein